MITATRTSMNLKKMVGQRLRSAREEAGLLQAQLAKTVGVAQNTLSQYEAGAVDIPFEKIVRLARALDKPLSYFDPNVK